jgi:hypothetical protein
MTMTLRRGTLLVSVAALLASSGCAGRHGDVDAQGRLSDASIDSTLENPGLEPVDAGLKTDSVTMTDAATDAPDVLDSSANDASVPSSSAWVWGDSTATENESLEFIGYDQGCAELGAISRTGTQISLRVGYTLQKPVADRLKHYAGSPGAVPADDGPLSGHSVVGTVLLIRATKEERYATGDSTSAAVGPLYRIGDPASSPASRVSMTATIQLPDVDPCLGSIYSCRLMLRPTFVVVWQNSASGRRAYQFIRPLGVSVGRLQTPRFVDCPVLNTGENSFHQSLGVYWPLEETFARHLEGAPEPRRWTTWIDEVLPR